MCTGEYVVHTHTRILRNTSYTHTHTRILKNMSYTHTHVLRNTSYIRTHILRNASYTNTHVHMDLYLHMHTDKHSYTIHMHTHKLLRGKEVFLLYLQLIRVHKYLKINNRVREDDTMVTNSGYSPESPGSIPGAPMWRFTMVYNSNSRRKQCPLLASVGTFMEHRAARLVGRWIFCCGLLFVLVFL